MIKQALPHCLKLIFIRAKAYTVIGLGCLSSGENTDYISELASSLAKQYDFHNDGDWHWFEDNMTYGDATLPWAMLTAYQITKEKQFREIGFQSLDFLKEMTFTENYFKPIGCNGWLQKGNESAGFDEQPVEACEMTIAFLEANAVSRNKKYLSLAKMCFSWYHGNNSGKLCLLDQETGGCFPEIQSRARELTVKHRNK